MNLRIAKRSIDCLYRACLKQEGNPEQYPFYPQKTKSFWGRKADRMERPKAPEKYGIPSEYLVDFLEALEEDHGSVMHTVLVYADGDLICSAASPGYSPGVWSLTHSMAKTVTSFALASLIGEGAVSLNQPILDFFPDEAPALASGKMKKITVRDLLTMRAGVDDVNELAAVTITDWKRSFLASSPFTQRDKVFYYNSINSYILAAIVEKVTQKTLEEVLEERLFCPLGIHHYHIEKSPEGIAKGGWGMFLTPYDMAKLGELVLRGGKWHGKEILPPDYLKEAILPHSRLTDAYGAYDYGYHIWVERDGDGILFNGMLGQNVWISPKHQMVIVTTAGNDEFFQSSTTLDIINRFFGKEFSRKDWLPPDLFNQPRLRNREKAFFTQRRIIGEGLRHHDSPLTAYAPRPIPKRAYEIVGTYQVEKNLCGILPLSLRLIYGNHTKGIASVGFQIINDNFYLQVTEGDVCRTFPADFGCHRYSEQDFQGEKYLVGCACRFAKNEDNEEVFVIDITFPEMPNTRKIKCYFRKGGHMVLHMTETPGAPVVESILRSVSTNSTAFLSGVVNLVTNTIKTGEYFQKRIMDCMEPILHAHKEGCDDCLPHPKQREVDRAMAYRTKLKKQSPKQT